MECDPQIIKDQLSNLVTRLNECHEKKEDTKLYLGRLLLRIHSQYPGDVGCFVIYFLNYVQLEPFESIFFHANIPHAYISGGNVVYIALDLLVLVVFIHLSIHSPPLIHFITTNSILQ